MQITTLWAAGLCTAGLVSSLPAQILTQNSLRTATPIGVFAQQGNQLDYKTIPANKVIPAGAGTSVAATAGNTHQTTLVSWRVRNGVTSADISEQGGISPSPLLPVAACGTSASPLGTRPSPGPHAFLLRLKGRPGSEAMAEFWATGGTTGGTRRDIPGGYVIDFGNDGSPEFKASLLRFQRNSLVLRFPASGTLDVRLQSEVHLKSSSAGSLAYKSGLSIRVTPAPTCIAASYGEGCGPHLGATFSNTPIGRGVSLEVARGRSGAPGMIGVGKRQLSVDLPGLQCKLLVNPLVVAGFRFDNNGQAIWNTRLPNSSFRFDLRVQVIELGNFLGARASNGLHLFCSQ